MKKRINIFHTILLLCVLQICLLTGCKDTAESDLSNEEMTVDETEESVPVIVFKDKKDEALTEDTEEKSLEANSEADLLNVVTEKTDADNGEDKDINPRADNGVDADSDTEADKESEDKTDDNSAVNNEFYISEITDDIKLRINGISYPGGDMQISYDDLRYLHLLYKDFNNNTQNGELICNKKIADDLLDIFTKLYEADYQIDKIRLIDEYGGDDDASCADDNTSCFNYRVVTGGKKLSNHAYGMAIDINPFYNPYVKYNNGSPSVLLPATAAYIDRSADFPHKIDENDLCYKLFAEHGFKWGGYYKSVKDYQHFEK